MPAEKDHGIAMALGRIEQPQIAYFLPTADCLFCASGIPYLRMVPMCFHKE
jgi:hypothetical protein